MGPGIWRVEGRNGGGKGSLIRAIAGDIPLASGSILIRDRSGAGHPGEVRARRKIGYVPSIPDQPGFLSVRDAWRLMAALRDQPGWAGEPLEAALGLVGSRRLDTLSTGQRRKAELLCALAGDPEVLLLDESLAPWIRRPARWWLAGLHPGKPPV